MIKARIRKTYLTLADIVAMNVAFLFAIFLQYEGHIPEVTLTGYFSCAVVITIIKLLSYRYFELYNSVWEYASIEELMKVVMAVTAGSLVSIVYTKSVQYDLYIGIFLVALVLEIGFIGGIRFAYRMLRRLKQHRTITRQENKKHVLIIGTGHVGTMIATVIKNHSDVHGKVVGFIDDDPAKLYKTIAGIKVLGNQQDIFSVVNRFCIDEIIVAMAETKPKEVKRILAECKRSNAKVRIAPGFKELIDGQVSMSKIRDVEIEDLLGRDSVDLNVTEIAGYIEGRTILVTGGGGSIGSELCRQIAKFEPKELIILDIYENNAYDIQNELKHDFPRLELDVIIASVRDRNTIFNVIKTHRPDVIFHAAAHKHVPLMERSPKEAIKNNTFGTMNVAEAALEYNVSEFILISTDKAVNPTNIMGASKRMCEMVIQGLAKNSTKTKFAAVRFGNVLGSNGSVIPLFKRQIQEGGPVTVTHKEIIRYFMTIPEAAQLVIQAGAIAEGGEIFVLDMGDPVRIYDLAVDLIKLSGFKPHEEIDIEVTGLRPGEKLFEELLMDDEGLEDTRYEKIYIGQPGEIDYKMLKKSLLSLEQAMELDDVEETIEMISHIVPTYRNNIEVNKENKHQTEGTKKYHRKDS
jgi:FlaA1/EpsC-like NDP-sugar epimerase